MSIKLSQHETSDKNYVPSQAMQARINRLYINQDAIDEFEASEDAASIKSALSFQDELINRILGDEELQGAKLPWVKTHDKIRFRKKELSLWSGYNGHKKSMMLGQVALDLICQGEKVCIASMELSPAQTLQRMCVQAIGNQRPGVEWILKFLNFLEGKLFIYDQQNSVAKDRILKMARYACVKLKCNHAMIDSMMKCGIKPDDYGTQKQFINDLCSIAKDTDSHVHLVVHMRKPPEKHNHIPNRYDIAGGSDISNQADNIFICWSDIQKNHERNKPEQYRDQEIMERVCQKLVVEKQRNGEFEGRLTLEFDTRSLQMFNGATKKYYEQF